MPITSFSTTFPFCPQDEATVLVTAATGAQTISLAPVPKSSNSLQRQVRVVNKSSTIEAQIRFGTSAAMGAATLTTSIPIPANDIEIFTLPANVTHVSVITGSSTAVLAFSIGAGV